MKKYGYIGILLAFAIGFAGCNEPQTQSEEAQTEAGEVQTDDQGRIEQVYQDRNTQEAEEPSGTQEPPETPADENILDALQDEELERFAIEQLDGREASYAVLTENFGMKLGTVLYGREDDADFRIYFLLKGDWLGNTVSACVFSPEGIWVHGVSNSVSMERVDVNFDGYDDLLLYYGYAYGSGGSWDCYLALCWNEETRQFEEMMSFPDLVSALDLENQRVICRYQSGVAEEHVVEYTFSEGEWRCSRELVKCVRWNEEMAEERLYLYEYQGLYDVDGEPVNVTDVTDMSLEEIGALYPDLDYWWRG